MLNKKLVPLNSILFIGFIFTQIILIMFKELKNIEYLQTEIDNNKVVIENVNQQKTFIEKDKVKSTEIVYSGTGEKGFKITFF